MSSAAAKNRTASKRVLSDGEKQLVATMESLGSEMKAAIELLGDGKQMKRAITKIDDAVALTKAVVEG